MVNMVILLLSVLSSLLSLNFSIRARGDLENQQQLKTKFIRNGNKECHKKMFLCLMLT